MLQLVPSVPVFRVAVRLVKHWAQSRGIYGNVLGYPGGVAFAIMVARICQLYPNAAPSLVVARFFSIYARWKVRSVCHLSCASCCLQWPTPVLLCPLGEGPGAMLRVWNPAVNPKVTICSALLFVLTFAQGPARSDAHRHAGVSGHVLHVRMQFGEISAD